MNLQLSPDQLKSLMDDVRAELVESLITRKHPTFKDGEEWDYLLECEVCGIMKINRRTLQSLKINRYPIGTGNKLTYYRLSEVHAYLQSLKEK
jgi:hypothetical protein